MQIIKTLILLVILIILLSPTQLVFGQSSNSNANDKSNKEQKNNKNQGDPNAPVGDNKTNPGQDKKQEEDNKTNPGQDKKSKELTMDTFTGNYLSFEYDLGSELLKNVTMYDALLFNQLLVENGSFSEQKVSQHLFKGDGIGSKFMAHDNPLCLIQIKARANITVHLNLTGNWLIDQTGSKITLNDSTSNMSIALRLLGKPGSNSFSISNSNISILLEKSSKIHIHVINVSAAKNKTASPGVFWFEQTKQAVFKSIDNENYAGDATITGSYGTPEMDVYSYPEDFVLGVEGIETENLLLSFIVSSEDPKGKFIMVSVLKETLGIPDDAEVKLFIDTQQVPIVSTVSDLNVDTAGYYRVYDNDGEQFVISIPHFSEHKLTIEFIGIEPDSEPLIKIWGIWDFVSIIGILVVILIAAIHLYTARKD